MALLCGKIEKEVEIKASADKFYKVLSYEAHHVPKASDHIHKIEVHEGDWNTPGSTKAWHYALDGNPEIFKEKVEVDDETKSIIFTAVEGHILEKYKSYKVTLQVVQKDNETGLVKTNCEYEKRKPDDQPPNKYMDMVVNVIKDVDAHLVNP